MKRSLLFTCLVAASCGLIGGAARVANSAGGQAGALVRLQPTFPGSAQTGNINVTGGIRGGYISLDAAGTNLVAISAGSNSIVSQSASVNAPSIVGTATAATNGGVWGRNTSSGAFGILGWTSIGVWASNGGSSSNLAGQFDGTVFANGAVGIGTSAPAPGIVLQVNSLMGSGNSFDGGVAFMHSNLTQGIGFGFNTIYATGSNTNQALGLRSRGTGNIELNASSGFIRGLGKLYVESGFGGTPTISLAVGDTDTGLNSSGDGGLDLYSNSTNVMNVRSTGVTVNGGIDATSSVLTRTGAIILNRVYNSSGYGVTEWASPSGFRILYAGAYGGSEGFIGALNNIGSTGTGGIVRTGDTTTSVFGTSKSFVEVNPDDPSTDIVYTCIEGPEAAMYCRGTGTLVNGRAHIDIPQHFRSLAEEGTITVILTPLSLDTRGMGVAHKGLDGIDVGEIAGGTGDFDFDWEVKATRKRFKNYKVERPWTDRLVTGTATKKAWTDRLESFRKDQDAQKNEP